MKLVPCGDLPFVPASHENPLAPGTLKRVLFTRDTVRPGIVQMVNWAKLAPGKSFSAHYHEDMQEIFVIVAGMAEMVVGEETCRLGPGDAILVEPREVHRMRNPGPDEVQYVVMGVSSGAGGKTVVVESP